MNSHYFVMNGYFAEKEKDNLTDCLTSIAFFKSTLVSVYKHVDSLQSHFFQTIRQSTEVRDR